MVHHGLSRCHITYHVCFPKMPVQLRARSTRPSYRAVLELPDDEGGPPLPEYDDSSESDFELAQPKDGQGRADDEDAVHDTEDDNPSIRDDESDVDPAPKSKGKGKGKRRAAATARTTAMPSLHRSAPTTLAPGLSRPNARQNYALPLPNINHRHRGIPVYLPVLQTRRLVDKPSMFSNSETVLTRSIADPVIRDRVNKANSHNVGRGPVWELMEDLSWFKESPSGDHTKPVVYDTLRVDNGWELLSPERASPYIPKGVDGSSHSPPLTCLFGPYGNQTKMQLKALQSYQMAQFFPDSKAHVFYSGAPVWTIDWCPAFVGDPPYRNKQYLAVGPFPSYCHSPEVGRKVARPSPASIQIWSLSPTQRTSDHESMDTDLDEDPGSMKCELIICIDCGPAHDLKWCPLPSHDKRSSSGSSLPSSLPGKLGLLGGAFEDGSVSLYTVPDPDDLLFSDKSPHHVRLSPSLRIELEDTMCWSMDWANSEVIAVGCTNGSVAIFRVKEALEHPTDQRLCPTHYFTVHQSAIRSVSWVRAPPTSTSGVSRPDRDPTVLVSGGYDGAQMVTDIRDLRGNMMNRTRDVINSIVFTNHVGGPLASDHENLIKSFGITPNALGRGHGLLDSSGPAWSIATSDFHPHIAVGSADGTCQTTNVMRSTRSGGAVPFFIHKIFQVDYNRTSDEYRMLENFLPHEHRDRPTASRDTKKKKEAALPVATGAWPPEVSVTRVTWQSGSGLARAPLLASATASGLCRVDWLLGRFNQNRFPYYTIESLRGEVEGAVDEDEEGE
ncbi:hypothetical protein JB92DRAFT_2993071 [Gautieria morchelliformis]|nr:hypothetical protein JB92DRAFT_2993071 [Gautieria morchelliformis]